ncbi:MAG: BamA/TamA family outer membrane protein [Vicinamibacterales bacterium]
MIVRTMLCRTILGLALLGVGAPAHGQSSRAEAIAAEQAAKAGRLAVEEAPTGEKVVTRVMSSPLLAGSGGVYPWFGSVYNGTGLAAGVGYLHRRGRGERLSIMAAGSTNGSLLVDASWRLPTFTAGGVVRPRVDARWARYEDVVYHGIGPATTEADKSSFDYRPREIAAGFVAEPARGLSVTAEYGYLGLTTLADTTDPRARPLTALGETLNYGITRTGAAWDWRPAAGYSTRGGVVRGNWSRYTAHGGRPYSFDELEAEVSQAVPFVREQFGLAVRALATTTVTGGGDRVPFILLPSIGGGDTVRGAPNRRFHDRSRVVLTGEYRWRPSRFLDMALFVDSGAVAPSLAEIDDQRFYTAWGIGARLHGPAFTALRVELARGRDGWRAVFAAGQPF